jgi:hypothetical protein
MRRLKPCCGVAGELGVYRILPPKRTQSQVQNYRAAGLEFPSLFGNANFDLDDGPEGELFNCSVLT